MQICTCTELPLQDKPLRKADAYRGRSIAADILLWPIQLLPVGPCHQGLQDIHQTQDLDDLHVPLKICLAVLCPSLQRRALLGHLLLHNAERIPPGNCPHLRGSA